MKFINTKIISGAVFLCVLLLAACGGGATGDRAAAADTTSPTTTAVPSVSGTSGTATTLSVTIDEDGTGYYLVLPATDPDPSVAAILASGSFAMTANVTASKTISGLTSATSYRIYFVAKDAANNVQAAVQNVPVTTTAVTDIIPPVTTAPPSVSGTEDISTILSVTINENGIGYYLVCLATDPVPTIGEVKAGGVFEMTANVAVNRFIGDVWSGSRNALKNYTSYIIYFIAEDEQNNLQSKLQTVSVTTTLYPTSWVQQGNLIWMQNNSFAGSWSHANTFCADASTYYTDWRLPTVAELNALYTSKAKEGHGWGVGWDWGYWSSGAKPGATDMYYAVDLNNGNVVELKDAPDVPQWIVCVR